MNQYDVIVIGAGVVGCSVAFHLAALGAKRVLVLERDQIGTGTTAQSSGILRTHYSVVENVALALASWKVFSDFSAYVGDEDASSGLVKCGYLIASPEGPKLAPLRASLLAQREIGIAVQLLDAHEASALLPIARFDDAAIMGFEPEAGFADAYLVTTSFARAARHKGVRFMEGVEVRQLLLNQGRVAGVDTPQGRFMAGSVVSAQNIWATDIARWTGIAMPVLPERHTPLAHREPAYRQIRAGCGVLTEPPPISQPVIRLPCGSSRGVVCSLAARISPRISISHFALSASASEALDTYPVAYEQSTWWQ